jgi:hypothetical protein
LQSVQWLEKPNEPHRRPGVGSCRPETLGPPWAPVFRVVDVGAGPDQGVHFGNHPRRRDWKGEAGESVGIYLFYAPRWEFTAGDRERIAEELRQRYDPPKGFID